MTFKYLVRVCVLALIVASCTTATPPATSSPSLSITRPGLVTSGPTAKQTRAPGLAVPVPVEALAPQRRWYTVPDGLTVSGAADRAAIVLARFASDPGGGNPVARVQPSDKEFPFLGPTGGPNEAGATIQLAGLAPGVYSVEVVEHLAGDTEAVVGRTEFVLSQPEYVVWTLDFEGDEASDTTMAHTAAVADGLHVPMTVLWNPRAWTSAAVSADRAAAMLAWTKGRATEGDEVGLHLHLWTDFVASAGVPPRLLPRWAGRGDGYDVPITAYSEDEQRALIAYGLRLMSDHGLTGVTSFRAGGDFGDAATVRALAANAMTADCTAVAAGTFGSLRLPWTLAPDAQPYAPSSDDANKPGDLPLLEAPTNGGNTYGYTSSSIATFVRADTAMLARPGEVAKERRGITIVSHPATIDATERAAIETLLHAFDAYRYDQDKGPLRFVTLRQLAQAWH
jgi:hypothetical protein